MGRYLELARKVVGKAPDPAPRPDPPPTATPDAARVLGMSLEQFGQAHLAVKVKIPDDTEPHWFVSGPPEVEGLRKEGVSRGVIWTARELADVMGAGWSRETIGRLIAVKRTFDGTVGHTPGEQAP